MKKLKGWLVMWLFKGEGIRRLVIDDDELIIMFNDIEVTSFELSTADIAMMAEGIKRAERNTGNVINFPISDKI